MRVAGDASVLQHAGEEVSAFPAGRTIKNLFHGSEFGDSAVGEEPDLICDAAGKTHLVGDQHEVTAFVPQFLDHLQYFSGHLRIQRGGWFVEKEEPGADGNGAGDRNALALASGERGGVFPGVIFELKSFQDFVSPLVGIGLRESVYLDQGKRDVAKRRKVWEQIKRLEHSADLAPVVSEGGFLKQNGFVVNRQAALIGGGSTRRGF